SNPATSSGTPSSCSPASWCSPSSSRGSRRGWGMTWENSAITIATLLPLVGALVIALVPRQYDKGVRALGIVFTGAALAFAIAITFTFDYGASGLQFQLNVPWIPAI